jgi:hypothetical protein
VIWPGWPIVDDPLWPCYNSYDGCAMKTLTWEQAAEWTNSDGLNATVDRSVQEYPTKDGKGKKVCRINKSIYFPNEDPALRLTLPLPHLPYQVAYLANALLPYSDSDEFQTCLLWMTDWGIWSEVSERVANSLVECFRSARGERNLLIDSPAHLFGETEAADAQTLLTIAIVFGWDCYVIPKHVSGMPPENPENCWICGKTVSSDDAGMDAFGVPVHFACNRALTREKPPTPKPPKAASNS